MIPFPPPHIVFPPIPPPPLPPNASETERKVYEFRLRQHREMVAEQQRFSKLYSAIMIVFGALMGTMAFAFALFGVSLIFYMLYKDFGLAGPLGVVVVIGGLVLAVAEVYKRL